MRAPFAMVTLPVTAKMAGRSPVNVNVPELINYMAINSIIRHHDSGWYNWWIARDTEGVGVNPPRESTRTSTSLSGPKSSRRADPNSARRVM